MTVDPQQIQLLIATRRFHAEVLNYGWSTPESMLPRLGLTFAGQAGRVKVFRVPLPAAIWRDRSPAETLDTLNLPRSLAPGFTGVVFSVEAWALHRDVPDWLTVAERREIRDHPQRQSIRMTQGYNRHDDACFIACYENDSHPTVVVTTWGETAEDGQKMVQSGAVPLALRHLVGQLAAIAGEEVNQ